MDEEVNDGGDELSTTASQEGEHKDAVPVISILNLVLDHYMSDPTVCCVNYYTPSQFCNFCLTIFV